MTMEPGEDDFAFGPFEAADGRWHRVIAAVSGEKVVVQHQQRHLGHGAEWELCDQEVFRP